MTATTARTATKGVLRVAVTGPAGGDAEELRELTASLRRALLSLEVDDVRPERSEGPAEQGTKGGGFVTGSLLVVGALGVRPVVRLVESWLQHRPVRSVRIELDGCAIELGAATAQEQQRIVESFLARLELSATTEPEPRPESER